ncbi:MAG: hypothetical protein ACK5LK_04845, partial [Chthoniobacterales bacterium]
MKNWKNRLFARLCTGAMASFRKRRLEFSPEDLAALHISFSQYGEDLLIADHLLNRKDKPRGIYIDAGCFDPFRLSNTRLLNLLGWSGVNIDASEETIAAFKRHRPNDQNICMALAEHSEKNEFIQTPSGASSRLAQGAVELGENHPIRAKTTVQTHPLREVLDGLPCADSPIDLLDIEC